MTEKLNLKGGILIIGSLYWDLNRENWRETSLNKDLTYTPVPIRYGRRSNSRKNTFTMIFSEHCKDKLGQGIIVGFNKHIHSFNDIYLQAQAAAKAEGIWKETNKNLNSNWGAIVILLNPNLDNNIREYILSEWVKNYSLGEFNPEIFKERNKECIISNKAVLNITWEKQMDDYDILLSTVTRPDPKTLITAKDIADSFLQNNYTEYFYNNRQSQIFTYQDLEIEKNLIKK